jgi:cell division protein FtsW (lipid II flippase)
VNLVLVGVITGTGFASVYIARQAVISAASLAYAGFFLGLYVLAHLAVRRALPDADPYLLPVAGLLTGIGLTEIYRINPDRAFRQGLWLVIAVALFAALVLFVRDHRGLDDVKYLLGVGAVVLLALPALPGLGRTVNGASLWVEIGPARFQPGELAKLAIVAFLAGYLRDNRELLAVGIPKPKHAGPLLLVWGAAMLVLFQTNDLGGALLYFSIVLAMLYVATARWLYVAGGLGLFALGAWGLHAVVPRVSERVATWLDPFADPTGDGYQLVQSFYALSSGGLFGTGLGRGVLTTPSGSTYVPFLETDFVYSALVQELGLAGAAAILLLYLVLAWRGTKIAVMADDGFSKLLAAGLTAAIAVQTFIIVGGVTGMIPLTGITLPFVSYGGSSLLANMLAVALLLMVSNRAYGSAGRRL